MKGMTVVSSIDQVMGSTRLTIEVSGELDIEQAQRLEAMFMHNLQDRYDQPETDIVVRGHHSR